MNFGQVFKTVFLQNETYPWLIWSVAYTYDDRHIGEGDTHFTSPRVTKFNTFRQLKWDLTQHFGVSIKHVRAGVQFSPVEVWRTLMMAIFDIKMNCFDQKL